MSLSSILEYDGAMILFPLQAPSRQRQRATLRRVAAVLLCALLTPFTAQAASEPDATPVIPYTLVETLPHEPAGFTQGLELYKGRLFETSGLYGQSRLFAQPFPKVPGGQMRGVALPDTIFAEGLTLYRDRVYMLSWKAQQGLVFDAEQFSFLGRFSYQGEGWGLCYSQALSEEGHFVMSNGSSELQWLSPRDMQVRQRLAVHSSAGPESQLNELECHRGYVLANQWQSDNVLIIAAASGRVLAKLDLSALKAEGLHPQAVLNGIAYDDRDDSWLVTGKLWPSIFRIRFTLPELPDGAPSASHKTTAR